MAIIADRVSPAFSLTSSDAALSFYGHGDSFFYACGQLRLHPARQRGSTRIMAVLVTLNRSSGAAHASFSLFTLQEGNGVFAHAWSRLCRQ